MTKVVAPALVFLLAIARAASAGDELLVTDTGANLLAVIRAPWPAANSKTPEDLRTIAQKAVVIGYVMGISDATEGLCLPTHDSHALVSVVQSHLEEKTSEQLRGWSY